MSIKTMVLKYIARDAAVNSGLCHDMDCEEDEEKFEKFWDEFGPKVDEELEELEKRCRRNWSIALGFISACASSIITRILCFYF